MKDRKVGEKGGQREGRWHFVRCLTRLVGIGGRLYLAVDEAIFGVALVVILDRREGSLRFVYTRLSVSITAGR